jgi:hypothetical protein
MCLTHFCRGQEASPAFSRLDTQEYALATYAQQVDLWIDDRFVLCANNRTPRMNRGAAAKSPPRGGGLGTGLKKLGLLKSGPPFVSLFPSQFACSRMFSSHQAQTEFTESLFRQNAMRTSLRPKRHQLEFMDLNLTH